MTSIDPRFVPVVIGIGEMRGDDTPREPAELAHSAAVAARSDASASVDVLAELESISVSNVASWAYDDLPATLARRFGASPSRRFSAPVGGQWPAALLDAAASRIAAGETRVELVAGAEAQASVTSMMRTGRDPVSDAGWSNEPGGPPTFDPDQLGTARMQRAGLIAPVRIYPLFEARYRYDSGLTPERNTAESSELYARFSAIAADNPVAWQRRARTASDIGTVGPANRMVCEPYPLSMNAMPHVDQAAAVIVSSLAAAREWGVPEDRLVYVWGGAGAVDTIDVLDRRDFGASDALAISLDRACANASLDPADLDVIDVYSCFPVVPKMAVSHLHTPRETTATVTGGHSSFGGPLNSYSVHAVAAAVRALRRGATRALVHANGGYMTYQHSVLLGSDAHPRGYVGTPEPVAVTPAGPAEAPVQSGTVTVETATVEYTKTGEPTTGFVVARTADGARLAAQTAPGDVAGAHALSVLGSGREIVGTDIEIEPVGHDGHVAIRAAAAIGSRR